MKGTTPTPHICSSIQPVSASALAFNHFDRDPIFTEYVHTRHVSQALKATSPIRVKQKANQEIKRRFQSSSVHGSRFDSTARTYACIYGWPHTTQGHPKSPCFQLRCFQMGTLQHNKTNHRRLKPVHLDSLSCTPMWNTATFRVDQRCTPERKPCTPASASCVVRKSLENIRLAPWKRGSGSVPTQQGMEA